MFFNTEKEIKYGESICSESSHDCLRDVIYKLYCLKNKQIFLLLKITSVVVDLVQQGKTIDVQKIDC